MKKLFLFALLATFVGTAQAQQTTVRAPEHVKSQILDNVSMEGPSIFREFMQAVEVPQRNDVSRRTVSPRLSKTGVYQELFEIGKSANTWGMLGDSRNQIAADPASGSVAVIWRGNDRGASDGNTLYIRYSTDQGATWSQQGDNISNTPNPRYPQVFLSDNGGTPAATAIWAQVTQYGDGNSGFGVVGSMKAGIGNSNPLYSPFPVPPLWSIPWEIIMNKATGYLYTVALALDPSNGASTGEIYLLVSTDKGATWNAELDNPVYTSDMIPTGYFDTNLRFDISPDGSTMVMAFSLIIESEPGRAFLVDPNHEIAWRVSTDLGKNWGPLQRLKPSEIANKPRPFDFQTTMSWDFDMALDKYNKPHFLTVLSADVNPFGLDRPTDTTISLNSADSTFVCEISQDDTGNWKIIPIGPSRRLRVDRLSFTSASTTSSAYVFRAEPKWARTIDGDKLFAKWISPFNTWRIGIVAGQPTLFADTLTQIYVNARHVDSRTANPYYHKWDFANPGNNTWEMDSLMRYTWNFAPFVDEEMQWGAKMTKIARYVTEEGDDASAHFATIRWGVGENIDDDPNFSDQSIMKGSARFRNLVASVQQLDAAPGAFELKQNFPNPFNPSTEIHFTLPEAGHTTLRVYNVLGQNVATLTDQYLDAGTHSTVFDAKSLPSGVYIYRLESAGSSMSKRMMLNK